MRKLRPSAAATWMNCPGQPAMVEYLELLDPTSVYAAEGTAAHELAAWTLSKPEREAGDRLGETIVVRDAGARFEFEVGQDMVDNVQSYVDHVRRESVGAEQLIIEQSIPMADLLMFPEASGTPDALVIRGSFAAIYDLKYGKGLTVEADDNLQLKIYAAAVWMHYGLLYDWDGVQVEINQPRKDHVVGAFIEAEELERFIPVVQQAADRALRVTAGDSLVPGEAQCRWCPVGRANKCPALRDYATEAALTEEGEQKPVTEAGLARDYAKLAMVKAWVQAVETQALAALKDGRELPGYKLVQGRAGNRVWSDPAEVEEAMKRMRLKKEVMYDMKLISPAKAQKALTERRWEKLQPLISQAPPSLTIAKADDKRPAQTPGAVQFDDLTEADGLI